MRLQSLSRSHALPSRGPRRFSWNRYRVLFLGHHLPSHAGPTPERPGLLYCPGFESPHSSPARSSACIAGSVSHEVLGNNLATLASSRPFVLARSRILRPAPPPQLKESKPLDRQSQNELRVFESFARICPYSIDVETIEKRNPPEPDILCRLDGMPTAFEIVECLDSSLSRSIYDSCKVARALYNEIETLAAGEKHRIKANFNTLITIVFHKDISLTKKRSLMKAIFDLLWTAENEEKLKNMARALMSPGEGRQLALMCEDEHINEDELLKREPIYESVAQEYEFDLKLPKALRDYVKRITVSSLYLDSGPSFAITETVWFSDPIEERINEKLKKKYITEHMAELLVYYEVQPELPAEYWILPCLDSVTDTLEKSIFRRLWLYSVTKDEIIDVIPDQYCAMDQKDRA